jgi:hypothetical protein
LCADLAAAVLSCFPPFSCPPGGFFDPLGLASDNDPEKVFRLKTAEIKHGRLAMVAFAGEYCFGCDRLVSSFSANTVSRVGTHLLGAQPRSPSTYVSASLLLLLLHEIRECRGSRQP